MQGSVALGQRDPWRGGRRSALDVVEERRGDAARRRDGRGWRGGRRQCEQPVGAAHHRLIDHRAIQRCGGPTPGGHRPDGRLHALRPPALASARRELGLDRRDLCRVDRPLAVEPQLPRCPRRIRHGLRIAQRERRPVDGGRPSNPGRGQRSLLRDQPSRHVVLRPTAPERRGQIRVAEDQRDHPLMLSDVRRGREPLRRLDDGLNRRHLRGRRDVVHRLDLRDHDRQLLQPQPRAQGKVLRLLRRARAVDADRHRPGRPLRPPQRLGQHGASGRLGVQRDRVLEVEDHLIRPGIQRLGMHLRQMPRNDESRHDHLREP